MLTHSNIQRRGDTISTATMKPSSELLIEKDAASSTPHVSVILQKQLIPLCPDTQYLLEIHLKTSESITCIDKRYLVVLVHLKMKIIINYSPSSNTRSILLSPNTI